MGYITNYAKERMLKSILALSQSYSYNIYVGYSSTEPTIDGANVTENPNITRRRVASEDYMHLPEVTSIRWDNEAKKIVSIYDIILAVKDDFDVENNPVLNYVCIFNAERNGNLLFYQQLTSPITLEPETGIVISAGNLQIDITNL